MATIKEVAARAGVSVATVSRVINNSAYVSRPLTEKVEAVLVEMDYALNIPARSLRTRKSGNILMVDTEESFLANPFFTEMAQGVEVAATVAGYSVILRCIKDDPGGEGAVASLLRQHKVDGVVVSGVLEGSRIVKWLQSQSHPFVLISRRPASYVGNYVGANDREGMRMAVEQLYSLGHRRIAYIRGDDKSSASQERFAGYVEGLAEGGISLDQDLVGQGAYDYASGYTAMGQLLARSSGLTAVVAGNDRMAFGAWRLLRERGLRVPADLSLVGFDDMEAASAGPIGLTTVHVPKSAMGEQAAQLLIRVISAKGNAAPETIVLPVQLRARDTTGPLDTASAEVLAS